MPVGYQQTIKHSKKFRIQNQVYFKANDRKLLSDNTNLILRLYKQG